jgi:hypothetical protein
MKMPKAKLPAVARMNQEIEEKLNGVITLTELELMTVRALEYEFQACEARMQNCVAALKDVEARVNQYRHDLNRGYQVKIGETHFINFQNGEIRPRNPNGDEKPKVQ